MRSLRPLGLISLALFVTACSGTESPPPSLPDAAPADAGEVRDGGVDDAGERDAGTIDDAGSRDAGFDDAGDRDAGAPDAGSARPIVILMIGDGMGFPQIEAASQYLSGQSEALAMHQLPHRGQIRTASRSGLTDSAAAATAMATGTKTGNRRIGVDARGDLLETSVELAARLGYATGVVSTAHLSHATPASFSAHWADRDGFTDIAASQASVRPDVMLGGGALYLDSHVATFEAAGYRTVRDAAQLAALDRTEPHVLGLFSSEHMPYVLDRDSSSSVPSLVDMSMAAIEHLDATGRGFFLVIEGARIDMAAHENDRDRMITETVDFDRAVAAVDAWAAAREEVTLVVTADHECGGVTIDATNGAGAFPDVSWRWTQHTNQRVGVFARGPDTALFDNTIRDNTWVHAVTAARLEERPPEDPNPGLVVDGSLDDLTHRASTQVVTTEFGPGINQLDSLLVDADEERLAIGIEGLFQWDRNAVVVLIDADLGAGTGLAGIEGALSDRDGRIDGIITALNVRAPAVAGFGVDVAVGVWGGTPLRDEDLIGDAGFRGIVAPRGQTNDFFWTPVSTNFGEAVRTRVATSPAPGEGWELHVPWRALYPTLEGRVPPGATVGVAVVLVNDDGGFLSNQALPPFAPGTTNPGRGGASLPGVVSFPIDQNADGVPTDPGAPVVLP